jgi:hypothetical protein
MIPITVWEVIRSLFFLISFTVLPGLIIVYLIHRTLRMAEVVALTFGWSLVVNVLFGYIVHFADGTLDIYIVALLTWDLLGCIWVLRGLFRGAFKEDFQNPREWLFPALAFVIGIIWFGVILQNGPRIDYDWDHWFHIAHAREVIESQQIIPPNPYWPDIRLFEAFGMWHPLLAAVARSASVSVITLWRIGNAYMAALGFFVVYSIAGAFFSDKAKRLLAAVVFLGSGVGAMQITRTFLYPSASATLLLWISFGFLFKCLMETDRRWIFSAAVFGIVPLFIHPQEYIFLCFSAVALGISGLIWRLIRRRSFVGLREVWIVLLALIIIGAPIMLLRYPQTLTSSLSVEDSGSNPTDFELRLYDSGAAKFLAAVFPYYYKSGLLFHSIVPFNLLTLFLSLLLFRYWDPERAWFMLTLVWAPTLAALLPGLSWVTHLVLKETYAWRLFNIVPTPIVWSMAISTGIAGMLRKAKHSSIGEEKDRLRDWMYFVLSIALLAGVALGIAIIVKYDELTPRNSMDNPLRFQAMYEFLDQLDGTPAVVLSDPMTSYTIPALTKHRVVLNERSHGDRNDIYSRFADMRRLLSDPTQSRDEAIRMLDRYQIDFIVVNKLWIDRVFFPQMSFYSDYTLGFLGDNLQCFRRMYSDQGFDIFEYRHCRPSALMHKGYDPQVPIRASTNTIDSRVNKPLTGELTLVGFSLSKSEPILPGDELSLDLYWRAEEEIFESYAVWAELLCDYPGRARVYGKLLRERQEEKGGEIFRVEDFRWLSPPVSGVAQGDVWAQPFSLKIPWSFSGQLCDLSVYVLNRRQQVFDQEMLPSLLMEKELALPRVQLKNIEVRN